MDGSRIRKEKVADSKVSGYVCAGPESLIFLVNHSKSDSAREGRAGNPRRTRTERPEQEFPFCYNFSSFLPSHDFSISLASRGSEEIRTTSRGLVVDM